MLALDHLSFDPSGSPKVMHPHKATPPPLIVKGFIVPGLTLANTSASCTGNSNFSEQVNFPWSQQPQRKSANPEPFKEVNTLTGSQNYF